VPTLVVHGTDDPIVPLGPDGFSAIVDPTTPPALQELLSSSIGQEVATSARRAGCQEQPISLDLAADVTELTYSGCAHDAEHRLVLIDGGGHTWPGSPTPPDAVLGVTTTNYDATDASWEFFSAHGGG
jgi:polyhydroxybutyrate depolymerase